MWPRERAVEMYKAVASLTDERFSSLFRDFKQTAYRLESLQRYNVDYEKVPFQDFLEGHDRYTHPEQLEWVNLIKQNIEAGKTMSRVHIVEEPLSDYMRFEMLWPYKDSTAAGESINILPVKRGSWPADVPRQDYWLFDARQVVVMQYQEDGSFVSAGFLENPEDIVQYNVWRVAAMRHSVPYEQYVSKLE